MDIEDILNEGHTNINSVLIGRMHRFAGRELVANMNSVLGSYDNALDWFYSKRIIDGKSVLRPYDLCLRNERKAVKEMLGRMGKYNAKKAGL